MADGNDEDYEQTSEPYGEDEGSELEQQIAQQEQELAEAEAKRQFEIEEKLLRNKLHQIFRDVSVSSRTSFKITEKATIKQAKAHPNLKNEINKINILILSNKAKNVSKLISSSPALFYVLMGIVIIFLLIAVIAFVGALLGADTGGGDGGSNAIAGITGNDFYGARMVYKDDELARTSMIEDYIELIEKGIDEAESVNSITVGETSYTIELTINITLPEEDFDYSSLTEEEFSSNYSTLYNMVFEISKTVYAVDNGTTFSGATLFDCVDGIKYFGFANLGNVSALISSNIVDNSTFIAKDSGGSVVSDNLTLTTIETETETQIQNNLVQLFAEAKYSLRAEKLFVKDFILENDGAMMTGIQKENYVAMIFMPKKNVTFTQLSFTISNTNFENFTINITANDNPINLTTDGANISLTSGQEAYIYSTASLNVSVNSFEDIDVNNLNALVDGMSLFDVVESVDNYETYLGATTDENSISYLTFKKNGVIVNLFNTEAFNFVEWETSWQSAS